MAKVFFRNSGSEANDSQDLFRNANLHRGSPQDFVLQTVQQKQVKLVQDENQLLENILRTLIQELVIV
ncbi:suppressor of the transcriptional defect of hpr1 by overexpression [Orobanche minor]